MRLLLLEPEARLAHALTALLQDGAHQVEWHDSGEQIASDPGFDAWLVDTALPPQAQLLLQRQRRALLKHGAPPPVILIGERLPKAEQMVAWEVGACDCLLKPVAPELLDARLRAAARRIAAPGDCSALIGDCYVDWDRQIALRQNRRLHLTAQEWAVTAVLAERFGRTVSKAELVALLPVASGHNAVEFHVSRLRRKLGAEAIQTLRGAGYRLTPRNGFRAAG